MGVALVATASLVASGLIGMLWGPRNEGKSLEQIEAERAAA